MKTNPSYLAHQRKDDGAQQSLQEHLLGVAEMAKSFAAKIRLPEQGEMLGLLHDLGKYSKEFQNYFRSAVGLINPDEDDFVDARGLKGKVDHSTAGAQLVWEELSKRSQLGHIVGQILALCIASHHSGLIDCLSSDATGSTACAMSARGRESRSELSDKAITGSEQSQGQQSNHRVRSNHRAITGAITGSGLNLDSALYRTRRAVIFCGS